MSGDSIVPTIPPPSPPSSGGGEPKNDRYGSGGYFSGGDNSGRGGKGGGFTEPLPYFRIIRRHGHYYWYVNFRYEPHWGEYSVCIYHIRTNVDWQDLSNDEKQKIYDMAELVWEVANDTSKEKRFSEYYKSIDDKYQNGYYFARAKVKDKLGKPTVCQPFPVEGTFVIPDKLKSFYIEESPYYVNNYTNPVSCLTIAYSPPQNMTGFWGVKLYIQGYHGDNEIRELAIKKYDKTKGDMDIFNIFLEPDDNVLLENYIVGDSEEENFNNIMFPVKRAFKVDYISNSPEAIQIEMYEYNYLTSQWQASDPNGNFYLDNRTRIGDTIILTAGGSGPTGYEIEAIIKEYDATYPHRKARCILKNNPSDINPPTYSDGSISPYLNWKVVSSCKFYLVSINEYGYHGDLESEALVQYCALDGLESAPVPPLSVEAYQCENQNVVSFIYPHTAIDFDDLDSFNIYRSKSNDLTWRKIATIKAKSSYETGSPVGSSEPYKYVDGDMANLYWDGQTWNYDIYVWYGVATVDKAGRESIIQVATHYLIDGTVSDGIPFRRGTGVDHSPVTVVRGEVFNLFYNSEASWDYFSGAITGTGNAHYNDWALWGPDTEVAPGSGTIAHPGVSMTWLASSFRFRLNFSTANERNKWIRILTQSNSTPIPSSSDITYQVRDYIGLGRAKLIIPGVQYYCRINYLFAQYTNNYLYIYPDTQELPAFVSDISFSKAEYFISIAPYQHSLPLPNIFIHEANTLNYLANKPLFRNGWIYMHSGSMPPVFENGVFGLYAPIIRHYLELTNSITNFSFTLGSHTLVSISVYVEIPFNGTNNKIDIGVSGWPYYFIKDLDVSTRGWKYFTYEHPLPYSTSGVTYVGQYKGTGATQGRVNIYFDVYTSNVSGRCLWEQRIRKKIIYPGQAITFSCFLARDTVMSAGGFNYGTFSFYIKPETYYIFDGYFSMPSMDDYQASISLNACKNRTVGGNLQYEYIVLYGEVPTNYNWDNVKYVRMGVIADWGQNDAKYNYIMTKPMLNYGNEAAPYTNKNQPDRLTMYSPSEYIPGNTPPNHDEDDPMCLAEGQYVIMWNGEMKRIEELKIGEMVRSIGMTSTIKHIDKAMDRETMVFIMEGNHILECTPEHLCLTDIFMPKPAKDIKIGDAMLTMDNKKIRVMDIRKRRNNVYKIETSLPHIFLVNGIWTHNVKAGGGEY